MGKKSYLSLQIKLISLSTYDLFTDELLLIYQQMIQNINNILRLNLALKLNKLHDPTIRLQYIAQKKLCQKKLAELVAEYDNKPRTVNIKSIVDKNRYKTGLEIQYPEGINWWNLKISKKITLFSSELSRALGLKDKQVTFDKIIIKWKSLDVLRQIVVNGFDMNILLDDGEIETKHYVFMTASAGQLRTDRLQMVSQLAMLKINMRLMCGLTFDNINKHNGINMSKLMAYRALGTSATLCWEDFDIDRTIVIKDFEAPVTGVMKYINKDYTTLTGLRTVVINHCDGSGMMLPSVTNGKYTNFMIRMPWVRTNSSCKMR